MRIMNICSRLCGKGLWSLAFFVGSALATPAWSSLPDHYASCASQFSVPSAPFPDVRLTLRQQAPPEGEEDARRTRKNHEGLSPENKTPLKDKSRKWQSLGPEEKQEMRRRIQKYRELPRGDQERYQKRYKQWQAIPPEDRNRIRDRLKNWDRLSPQEQEDVLKQFRKR